MNLKWLVDHLTTIEICYSNGLLSISQPQNHFIAENRSFMTGPSGAKRTLEFIETNTKQMALIRAISQSNKILEEATVMPCSNSPLPKKTSESMPKRPK